jgi:hypothetical protein
MAMIRISTQVTAPSRLLAPHRVERAVQYVRGNFLAGESFTGLADTQARVAPRHRRDGDPRHDPIAAGGGVR